MSKNNTRKIKCISECSDKKSLHPLSLIEIKKNEKSCSINSINFLDLFNNLALVKKCNNNDNITKEEIKKNMLFPNININHDYIIKMYELSDIESLKNWVNNNVKNKPYQTVERVINSWILTNLDELKYFNNSLFDILKLFLLETSKIKENVIDKELAKFIDYWVNKINKDNFNLNLITDFKNFLSKKYND